MITDHELQILRLVASGKSDREIADELGLHTEAVKGRLKRLRARNGFRRRSQLVVWALENAALRPLAGFPGSVERVALLERRARNGIPLFVGEPRLTAES